jgi:hypothetical protein
MIRASPSCPEHLNPSAARSKPRSSQACARASHGCPIRDNVIGSGSPPRTQPRRLGAPLGPGSKFARASDQGAGARRPPRPPARPHLRRPEVLPRPPPRGVHDLRRRRARRRPRRPQVGPLYEPGLVRRSAYAPQRMPIRTPSERMPPCRLGRAEAWAKCVRRATGRLEHSRVMHDGARSTSPDRQSRSRRGHRPRRHAAWTSRSTCRGPAD